MEVNVKKKKWMWKLGAPLLALVVVSACGTANDNDEATGDKNERGTETPDNNLGNETQENEAPDNDMPENDNQNKNNGEPTAPEDGERDQIQEEDQNVE